MVIKWAFPVFPLQWTDPFTGEVSSGYRESGYFPEAMINILAFLGWNPGTEQELFSLNELAAIFTLDRVGKSGARFDPEKARWYNQQYMKAKSDDELAALFIPVIQHKRISVNPGFIKKVAAMVKERLVFPHEFWEQASFFFEGPTAYDQQMQKKVWKEDTPQIIASVKELLRETKDFSSVGLERMIKEYTEQHNLGFGRVAAPLRLLIVGSAMGPHLFDILEMIGREACLERIDRGTGKMLS